ncbi:MAG: phage late control D family protein [bacterium]
MEHENFTIEIEGEEASDIYQDLISLEVELDDRLASMFRLKMATLLEEEGLWRHLDDERFRVWKKVAISAGFESGIEEVISGYITHVKPYFDPDPSQCILEIWGMDGSVFLDREEKLKDWPNKKDSDIASELFNLYGFTPEVEDTAVVHDEAISTILQRETDMQFLNRLALRNGFECYVEGTTGYFRSPQVDETPQPLLAAHFGDETNLKHFSIEVDALKPANVAMFQVDRMNKEILDVVVEASQQKSLGGTDTAGILASGMNPGQIYVGMNVATGNPEMTTLCQGLFHQAEWFVKGEGEIDGNFYSHVLKPRRMVTIKGVSEAYSGVYYVSHVTHSFTVDGYSQFFQVRRNALMPSGTEDFAASS